MKKFVFLVLIVMLFNLFAVPVSANTIECSYTISGRQVVLNGKVEGVNQKCEVTLLVGTEEDIIYLNQVSSDHWGNFEFKFNMPSTAEYREYNYYIGSNVSDNAHRGIINYIYTPPEIERIFFDATLNIDIKNYIPTITSTFNCISGKYTQFKVVNMTDNTIIAEDNITVSNDEYNIECTLPSLLRNKKYNIQIKSVDGEQQLVYLDIIIDSSILMLDVSGTVEVGEGVRLDTELNAENIEMLNKSSTITTNKTISLTVPNLVANMSADITMQGTETIPDPDEVPEQNEKNYTQILTDKNYVYTLDKNKEFVWFCVKPKYTGIYQVNIPDNFNVSIYENSNGIIRHLGSEEKYMSYPNDYYIQINYSEVDNTLEFSIDNVNGKTIGKAFEVLDGTSKYFTNAKDYGKIYKNETLLENIASLKGSLWLCKYNNSIYFNQNNSLHRITDDIHEIVDLNVDAKYIVADENNIYFSNWSDSGKLYKGYLNTDNTMVFEKICNDIVSWITVDGDYIYYKNNLDRNQIYRVLKTATNLITGEKTE